MEAVKLIVEYIFYCLIPAGVLCLWIVGIVTMIRSLLKRKDHPYGRKETVLSAVDFLLLIAFGWCAARYMLYGFMGQPEGWKNVLLNVVSPIANLIAPLSVWSVAISISRRKEGKHDRWPMMLILCILIHIICLIAFYLIYGPA